MPTDLTHKVIKGQITTLEEFAKTCARGFGPLIHMRDDPLDAPYRPRKPNEYNADNAKRLQKEKEELANLSDEEISSMLQDRRKADLQNHKENIERSLKIQDRIKPLLEEARQWTPPSPAHNYFKEFMIEQLESTLKLEGSTGHYERQLKHLEAQPIPTPAQYRKDQLAYIEERISWHAKMQEKEEQVCDENNKWAEQIFNSFK